MTVGWKPRILSEIGDREEIRISSERTGGGYNRWTPVWVVRVGDDLYVRTSKHGSPSALVVISATGGGGKRADGVHVVPISALGP